MILHIDTKDQKKVIVELKENGKSLPAGRQVVKSLSWENEHGSEILLPLIMKLLQHQVLDFSNIDGIEVEDGPGSYTGLRVGASVANALGFSLGVPVNGKKIETELNY